MPSQCGDDNGSSLRRPLDRPPNDREWRGPRFLWAFPRWRWHRRALASAERAKAKEAMAGYEARAALREALIGTAAQARRRAAAALAFSTGRDGQYGAALALALAGDHWEVENRLARATKLRLRD